MPVLVVLCAFLVYFLGYRFYSKYLSEKVFSLAGKEVLTPAHRHEDGIDYVPTKPSVLFGHHYASIAGLAPILGPAVAVIWGWLPALVWIVLGGVFIGCVHDFGSLVVSMRYDGKSVGQVAQAVIGHRARTLFHAIIFFLVSLAMGVFVLVIAGLYSAPSAPLTKIPVKSEAVSVQEVKEKHDGGQLKTEGSAPLRSNFPESVAPTAALMIAAIVVGYLHYRKNYSLKKLTAVSLAFVMFIIYFCMKKEFMDWSGLNDPERSPSADTWKWILLFYAFIASVTPVWLLLQSRDYINSFLLYLGIILIYLGFFTGAFQGDFASFHSSAVRTENIGLSIIPFVFITIACGAVSGFHALVSSGTTAKQIDQEKDARVIGYGGMIGESLLGLTSVIACTVGFSSDAEWNMYYKSWAGLQGLSVQVGAYISGTGKFLSRLGISEDFGQGFIALIVISFALTSLDSATRLLRYNIEEIVHSFKSETLNRILANRYSSSIIACGAIAFFAFLKIESGGTSKPAGLALWKLFGTTNQLLAGLALLSITIYIVRIRKNPLFTFLPMVFILFVTLWAMIENFIEFISPKTQSLMLAAVGGVLILLTLWLAVEGILVYLHLRKKHRLGE
ncbi:MAG TPA: carbon starvation protein A [Leptospiraceae bacterium]|nr:carbon starvation protein A [Leptospiraceae bacterium]HNF15092.1 carbon starvation protein A [Leptospiraceae bacterium]